MNMQIHQQTRTQACLNKPLMALELFQQTTIQLTFLYFVCFYLHKCISLCFFYILYVSINTIMYIFICPRMALVWSEQTNTNYSNLSLQLFPFRLIHINNQCLSWNDLCTINYSYQFIFLGGLGIIGLGIIYGTKQTNSFSMNMCILVFSASEMLINTTIKLTMEKNVNMKWYH